MKRISLLLLQGIWIQTTSNFIGKERKEATIYWIPASTVADLGYILFLDLDNKSMVIRAITSILQTKETCSKSLVTCPGSCSSQWRNRDLECPQSLFSLPCFPPSFHFFFSCLMTMGVLLGAEEWGTPVQRLIKAVSLLQGACSVFIRSATGIGAGLLFGVEDCPTSQDIQHHCDN